MEPQITQITQINKKILRKKIGQKKVFYNRRYAYERKKNREKA
jgi:hypothetical protein